MQEQGSNFGAQAFVNEALTASRQDSAERAEVIAKQKQIEVKLQQLLTECGKYQSPPDSTEDYISRFTPPAPIQTAAGELNLSVTEVVNPRAVFSPTGDPIAIPVNYRIGLQLGEKHATLVDIDIRRQRMQGQFGRRITMVTEAEKVLGLVKYIEQNTPRPQEEIPFTDY